MGGGEKLCRVSTIACMTPPNSMLVHDQAARGLRKGGGVGIMHAEEALAAVYLRTEHLQISPSNRGKPGTK